VARDGKTYKLSSLFLPPSSKKYPFTFIPGEVKREMYLPADSAEKVKKWI